MKNQKIEFEITHLFQILNSPRWLVMMFLLPMLMMAHFALAATTVAPAPDPAAPATSVADKFDHVKTGFNLTGAHAMARCASCHINNVFKGAPRDCATCHRTANLMAATAKPTNHINTNSQCDTCHKTSVWTPAIFSHVGMPDGQCATCHNGTTALGKSNTHIPVPATISCDNCHKTTSWLQYTFSHKNINSGCSDCHGGQTFTGVPVQPKSKPNNHYATALDCVQCHSTTNFVILKAGAPVSFIQGQHIPTLQPCSVCHNGGSFAPARMSHAGIFSNCEQCHNGTNFSQGAGVTPRTKPNPPAHIDTTLPCVSCHTVTTSFTLPPGSIIPMPAGHLPSAQPCSTCHNLSTGFIPAKMSHAGISINCADCHTAGKTYSGSPNMRIVAKSGIHVKTDRVTNGNACETCHNGSNTSGFKQFSGTGSAIMKHTGIANNCKECHVSSYVSSGTIVVKSDTTHVYTNKVIPGGDTCETCHSATGFTSFAGATMRHNGILSGCKTCHDGNTSFQGMGKATFWPTGHATQTDCVGSGCHNTTTFSSASGSKSANHIPTTSICSTCHRPDTTQTAIMLASGHAGITSGCATCHSGKSFADHTSATGLKPASKADFPPHVSTALDCANCHYPSSNGFSSFAGASGGALPLNHLPTTQPCSTCHLNGNYGPGSGQMGNHVGIVSGCATCHDNKTFAVGMKPMSKPTNHIPTNIPTAQPCEACHSISNFNSFSGTAMKHTGITDRCASCHDIGTNITGIVKLPVNHVPTSSTGAMGAAGSTCETCHSKTNFATFSGTLMNHTGVTALKCDSCHAPGKAYAGVTPRNVSSITNHIPYAANLLGGSTMDCNFCHKLTTVGGFSTLSVPSATMHNNSKGRGTGGDTAYCAGCHLSGTNYLGVQGRKSLTHEKPAPQPDCSNTACHKPLGREGTAYTSW